MNKYNETEFKKTVESHKSKYLKNFNSKFNKNELPTVFAKDEHGKLDMRLAKLHNSNLELNSTFFDIKKEKQTDIKKTFSQTIKKHCSKNKKDLKSVFNFSAELTALYDLKSIVGKLAYPNNVDIESEEVKKSELENLSFSSLDFTYAKKTLMLYYLIEEAILNESDLFPGVDKTVTGRFIEAIISDRTSGKNIHKTNIYIKIKQLYGNPENANESDLEYCKVRFLELKLNRIAHKIQLVINKKHKK